MLELVPGIDGRLAFVYAMVMFVSNKVSVSQYTQQGTTEALYMNMNRGVIATCLYTPLLNSAPTD